MFKKKNDISFSPVPKPPSTEQMVEDVKAATYDDPVFQEGSCKNMFEERTKLDAKFETVKEFIGAARDLEDLIKETKEKVTNLQSSKDELEKMTENIKQQAMKALK